MQNDSYEDIMNKIRQVLPVSGSAERINDSIMDNLSDLEYKRHHFIMLNANQQQWFVFTGIRTIMTTAAVILIGFFILQQSQINSKLSRLEEQVTVTQTTDSLYDQGSIARIQKVYELVQSEGIIMATDSMRVELLQINRKSLNFMLQTIQQLEKENLSIREKMQQFYIDSTSNNN
jgi:hypothetical protein